jgi:hypothetical protein
MKIAPMRNRSELTPKEDPVESTETTLPLRKETLRRVLFSAWPRRDARVVEDEADETFVEDRRYRLRPAEHVEQKLVAMLQAAPLCCSQLQRDVRPRPR